MPVGLVFAAWGGTSAESWTGKPALDTVPDFRIRADEQLANLASLPQRIKGFPAAIAAWEAAHGRVDAAPIGEAQGWAAPDADPAAWRPGNAAGKWRDNGMPNGGIAWLRKEITLPANAAGKDIRLDFGQVDGQCTTTYFNGEKVGSSGRTAPRFDAGYVNIPIRAVW